MSTPITEPDPPSKPKGVDKSTSIEGLVKGIYGLGCFAGAASIRTQLTTTIARLSILHYEWYLRYELQIDNDIRKFVITTTLTSRYSFEDSQRLLLTFETPDGDRLKSQKFPLDKSQPGQTFEVPYEQSWSIPFDRVNVFGLIEINDNKYILNNWVPNNEYSFTYIGKAHDCVLLVDGTKFYVHKVLATWSRFFDRLFYGDFKENNQLEIEIKEVSAHIFNLVLKLIHPHGSPVLTDENVEEVLILADRFEMPKIMALCGKHMSKFDSSCHGACKHDCLVKGLELGEKYNLPDLMIASYKEIHTMNGIERDRFFKENRARIRQLSKNTVLNLL